MPRTLTLLALLALWRLASAVVWLAGPDDYRERLAGLRPGDVLELRPGVYRQGLPIHGLRGRADARIVIQGQRGQARPRLVARPGHNTVSLVDAAYVTIRYLLLDGDGLDADAVKAEGHADWAHHIVLEDLRIVGHGRNQSVVGISTKCPAWGWEIRDVDIESAGTGMYLGQSDGSAPFVGGLIEHNRVWNPIGYAIQIKHQARRPDLPGLPPDGARSVIGYNVLGKPREAAGAMPRPNLLLGHFPRSGAGSGDLYVVYGNLFFENRRERLMQVEGNVAIYNNLFVNREGDALAIQPHHDIPRRIWVFHNTIVSRGQGIRLVATSGTRVQRVFGNLVFAGGPIEGGDQSGNLTADYERAEDYLRAPFAPVDTLDLRPRAGAAVARGMPELPDAGLELGGAPRKGWCPGAYGCACAQGGDGVIGPRRQAGLGQP